MTFTKPKEPVFAHLTDSLRKKMSDIVGTDTIQANGKEIKVNGVVNTRMDIEVVNGKAIPDDEQGRRALAQSLASSLRSALKDVYEYQHYRVLFIKIEHPSKYMTNRTILSEDFTVKDLE